MSAGFLAAALIAIGVVLLAGRAVFRDRRKSRRPSVIRLADPGSPLPGESWQRVPFDLIPGPPLLHWTPDYDAEQVTKCCGIPLAEIPPGERMTSDPDKITCRSYPTESE